VSATGLKPLPRRVRGLPSMAVVTKDGPHPGVKLRANGATGTGVILDGRATSVPFTAVLTLPNGQPRTRPRELRPAWSSVLAGDDPARSGLGAWSLRLEG